MKEMCINIPAGLFVSVGEGSGAMKILIVCVIKKNESNSFHYDQVYRYFRTNNDSSDNYTLLKVSDTTNGDITDTALIYPKRLRPKIPEEMRCLVATVTITELIKIHDSVQP